MPVIGFLRSSSPTDSVHFVTAFRKGLKEAGFVEIHLSLSWADAVSHHCTAHAQRFLYSLSRISRSLVLHLGVELGSDQDHDDRKPDPDHEADSGT